MANKIACRFIRVSSWRSIAVGEQESQHQCLGTGVELYHRQYGVSTNAVRSASTDFSAERAP